MQSLVSTEVSASSSKKNKSFGFNLKKLASPRKENESTLVSLGGNSDITFISLDEKSSNKERKKTNKTNKTNRDLSKRQPKSLENNKNKSSSSTTFLDFEDSRDSNNDDCVAESEATSEPINFSLRKNTNLSTVEPSLIIVQSLNKYEEYAVKDLFDTLDNKAKNVNANSDLGQEFKDLIDIALVFAKYTHKIENPQDFQTLKSTCNVISAYRSRITGYAEEKNEDCGSFNDTIDDLLKGISQTYHSKKMLYDFATFENSVANLQRFQDLAISGKMDIDNFWSIIKNLKEAFTVQLRFATKDDIANLVELSKKITEYQTFYANKAPGNQKTDTLYLIDAISMLNLRTKAIVKSNDLEKVINGLLRTFDIDFPNVQTEGDSSTTEEYFNLCTLLTKLEYPLESKKAFLKILPPEALKILSYFIVQAAGDIVKQERDIIRKKGYMDVSDQNM